MSKYNYSCKKDDLAQLDELAASRFSVPYFSTFTPTDFLETKYHIKRNIKILAPKEHQTFELRVFPYGTVIMQVSLCLVIGSMSNIVLKRSTK